MAEVFKSRKAALTWLKGEGYKISQGKFYQDCGDGFPQVNKDGTVSKYQTLLYGQKLKGEKKAAEPLSAREDELRKTKADADMAEMKAERMRREHDSMWLYSDDAYGQMAAIIGKLRDTIRHHLYTGQSELVYVAAGDQQRSQEVFESADAIIDAAFNEVAGDEVVIVFERGVD